MRRFSGAVLAAAIFWIGCGPSLRRVHQSTAYFERCHAADQDPAVETNGRHACWAAWLEHYTLGQPPDRVLYALDRLDALERGETDFTLTGEPLGETELDPTPTVAAVEPAATPTTAAPETDSCTAACQPTWRTCVDACDRAAAGCADACQVELRICTRGCYQ